MLSSDLHLIELGVIRIPTSSKKRAYNRAIEEGNDIAYHRGKKLGQIIRQYI